MAKAKAPAGTGHRGANRDYKQEYAAFGGTPSERHHRSERVLARRAETKAVGHKIPKLMEVDHIKPLVKGGSNEKGNLRLVPRKVNRSKGDRKE